MSAPDPATEHLVAQVAAMADALDLGHLELTGELLTRHDLELRQYMQGCAREHLQPARLAELLRLQLDLQAHMVQLREQAACAMGVAGHADRASRAYRSTEGS